MELYERLRIDESRIGKQYGKWKQLGPSFSIRRDDGDRIRLAVVECKCGAIAASFEYDLLHNKSTGCFSCRNHFGTRGVTKRAEYSLWRAMIQRCENRNNEQFCNYGERGISVCARWRKSFDDFISDVGPRPSRNHQIDRINNDGNYEPGNCRWATPSQNLRNTRRNRLVEYLGKQITVAELCELLPHLHHEVIRWRVRAGWTGDEISRTPSGCKRNNLE